MTDADADLHAKVADLSDRLVAASLCIQALLRSSPEAVELLRAPMPELDGDPNALALVAQVRKLLPPE